MFIGLRPNKAPLNGATIISFKFCRRVPLSILLLQPANLFQPRQNLKVEKAIRKRKKKSDEKYLGHSGEHVDERVEPVLLVLLGEGDDLQAEGEEGAVEEPVHQKHLTYEGNSCI
jgi:hypothetical protein